ncbi:ferritin-like domain-containing protein [Lentzea sp. NPDC034063]|uniref:ferritin-like domain-containing protein n=1 Tax=unclassified Lentzea TaxID=2643253 RepID=UPI0033F5B4D6
MSVFDLPRLHFGGTAVSHLPTGPRGGLVDLTTNTALTPDGTPFPPERPAGEYHDLLERTGRRFGVSGLPEADGPFSETRGTNFSGSGHFAVQARIVATELAAGAIDTADPLIGRAVDLWGHHNPYLATTVNRARVFDVDPTSDRTTTLVVGQFGFGRAGRSHDIGYLATGTVRGFQPPRWLNDFHGPDAGDHWLATVLRRSVVHQFVVTEDDLRWFDDAAISPAAQRLRASGADGLVVQFALSGLTAPAAPDQPSRWRLRGTIAPWYPDELRTYPAGRLLVPDAEETGGLHIASVRTTGDHVTLNLITALPTSPGGAPVDLGDLELRTTGGTLVATVPAEAYLGEQYDLTSGLVTVPASATPDEGLVLTAHRSKPLREREINVQTDDASLILEHPRAENDSEHDAEVLVRSYVRGRSQAVHDIEVRCEDIGAIRLSDERGTWSDTCLVSTDHIGQARLALRGAKPGTTTILLDGAGASSVRVLPDDWELDAIDAADVTFDLVHREVFAFYEHLFSFMKAEVFSLADQCKVETYAKLIWQMCDPRNKAMTYYMPPTRDLSEPKARLLLKYLRAQQKPEEVLLKVPRAERGGPRISTRDELVRLLREAATVELAVMLQYLYAAYSVPTYGAGAEYVRRGLWTPEQLRLACGDGGETLDEGLRSMLLGIAREEMIHFLLVGNILMALGEPFPVPRVDFGTINHELPVPLDFSLERLGLGSVERFTLIEQPDDLVDDVRRGDLATATGTHPYASLSELYAAIRDGLRDVPDLFLVEKGRGGGEHHLFLRESVDQRHPDYQLEVDDLPSALFAIDVITEQGEGGGSDPGADEASHYRSFLRIAELLREGPSNGAGAWSPAYPVMRNPTLRHGDHALETVTDPDARTVMELFNRAYFLTLQLMAQHFGERPDGSLRRSDLMNAAIDMMTGLMRPLAELLVTMPSGRRGRTAGPSFELTEQPAAVSRPDVARRALVRRLDDLATDCAKCPLVPVRVGEMSAFWADHFRVEGATPCSS